MSDQRCPKDPDGTRGPGAGERRPWTAKHPTLARVQYSAYSTLCTVSPDAGVKRNLCAQNLNHYTVLGRLLRTAVVHGTGCLSSPLVENVYLEPPPHCSPTGSSPRRRPR